MMKQVYTKLDIKESVSWVVIYVARKPWRRRYDRFRSGRFFRNTQVKPHHMVVVPDGTPLAKYLILIIHRKGWKTTECRANVLRLRVGAVTVSYADFQG